MTILKSLVCCYLKKLIICLLIFAFNTKTSQCNFQENTNEGALLNKREKLKALNFS